GSIVMAKKNVHRNTTSGTDSSSSEDDEFVSSSSSSEEESASSSSSEEESASSSSSEKKEVFIWVDSNLKDIFEIDIKITWAEQKDEIVTKLLPALRKLVDKRYKVTNKELLDMLYRRWHSRHREYNIRIQGEEKIKNNKRRTAKNSKMQDKKKRRVVAANYLIQNNDNYINRYPKKDLINILKETSYHLEEWEETDPEGEWPVTIPAVVEKIKEPLDPCDDPDEIDINNLELWLEKELIVKEAVKTKTTIDPTVNLLRTKQTTLKYKRIDGNVQETGTPPNGAPSWCLNKAALERLNRSTEVPIYDWDSENDSYNGDDDDDYNNPPDIDNNNNNRVE
ncbi:9000_t:CDS:2, partial [Rhizophagus irregularis]